MRPHQNPTSPARPAAGDLERLLAERGGHLMRAAMALTGSRQDGEDLLQAALERLLRNWRRVESDPEGYLRRILYNLAADGWRKRRAWRARLPLLSREFGEVASTDPVGTVDLRDALVRNLGLLAPRQRTALVLRYWELHMTVPSGFHREPVPYLPAETRA